MSMATKSVERIECLNRNTRGKMRIDANIYELFSKAFYHVLKENKQGVTYTEIVAGIKKCFKENKTLFKGSIEWYAVTVKHDMVASGIIQTFTEKGKKLHRLVVVKRK
jgi:hypothetical protein